MASKISVRLSSDLEERLSDYMAQTGLTQSQAVRDLLRQILTDAEAPSRGWHEGFARGHAECLRAYAEAARAVSPE